MAKLRPIILTQPRRREQVDNCRQTRVPPADSAKRWHTVRRRRAACRARASQMQRRTESIEYRRPRDDVPFASSLHPVHVGSVDAGGCTGQRALTKPRSLPERA